MESWLPWLHPAEHLLTDLLPPAAAGRAGRAAPGPGSGGRAGRRGGRAGRHAGHHVGRHAGGRVGRRPEGAGERFPRLYLPFDRLLAESSAPVLSLVSVAEGPATPAVTVRGFDPVAGDPSRLASQVTGLVDGGYSVTLCSPTDAGAGRLSTVLAGGGRRRAAVQRRGRLAGGPGRRGAARRRLRRAGRPGGGAVRVRRHRPAHAAPTGPPAGAADRRFLRRPRAGQLRRPPSARRRPLRRRDDARRSAGRPATTSCSSTAAATACTCRSTRSRR